MTLHRGKRVQTARQSRNRKTQGKAERSINRLLIQLIVSAAVFLIVFVGGGLIPNQVLDVFGSVHQMISGDNSLLESVQTLGSAVAEGDDWAGALREWCVDTFLPASIREEPEEASYDYLAVSAQFHSHLLPEYTYQQIPAEGIPALAPIS